MLKLAKVLVVGLSLVVSHHSLSKSSFDFDEKTGKMIVYTTEIDGKEYELNLNTFGLENHLKTLEMLEEAMAENNRLTEAYLKTNSPKWSDLMTEELKANFAKFKDIWKRIVIERHYNKEVLDAYDKYETAELENRDKMYEHFYSLSTNEPFKEKVKEAQKGNKVHLANRKLVTETLRSFLN